MAPDTVVEMSASIIHTPRNNMQDCGEITVVKESVGFGLGKYGLHLAVIISRMSPSTPWSRKLKQG